MPMPHFRAAVAGLTGAMIVFGSTGVLAQGNPQPDPQKDPITAPAPPESGFDVIVIGVMKGSSPEDFSQKVVEALPQQLKDPRTNFTSGVGFKRDRDYRLVIAFHGEDMMDADTLCTRTYEVDTTPPPEQANLMAATRVTAAFCEGAKPLKTATDRMVGSISPGQAGFRFLVSDITKQLFPDGFGTIPGTISSQPPGTMVTPAPPG
jgi:hypothetical protein